MPQFFFADGAQQKGPLPIDQLRSAGVTPETLVWHEGMSDWKPAADVPELAGLFAAAAPAGRGPDERGWVADRGTPEPGGGLPAPGSTVPAGLRPIGPGYAGASGAGQPIGYAAAGGTFAPGSQPIPGHGLGVASLVLGILSLVTGLFAFCMWWASVPLAVVTIVLGHIGQSQHRAATGRRNGMATAGLVCGYIAVVLNAIVAIVFAYLFRTASQNVQQQQPWQRQTQQTQPSGW